MRVLLVSHAQTDWNVQSRFQGHTDIPLNEYGRGQAHHWQRKLAEEPLEAIIASDLARASETAAILATPHGLSVQTDRRLRELSFGDWEGLTYAEIEQKYPRELAAWQQNYSQFSAPSGESLMDLERRLQLFARDLVRFPVHKIRDLPPLPLYSGGEGRGEGGAASLGWTLYMRGLPAPPHPQPLSPRVQGERGVDDGRETCEPETALERQAPMASALVVAHRGSLRALLCVLLGLPIGRQWDFRLEIASLSEVTLVGGKGSLERVNETLGEP